MNVPKPGPEGFPRWLNEQMNSRGWSVRETARRGGISHTPISFVLSGEQPSFETCVALARAFNLQPETVLRKAGLLPEVPDTNELAREVYLLGLLSEEDRQEVLEIVQLKIKRQEESDAIDRIVSLLEAVPEERVEAALDVLEAWLRARGIVRPKR
jgi:transcriptional regulator with XRE-family HTH domain